MKKKLLAILMATAMSMTLIACGGGEEETTRGEASVEVTEEDEVEEKAEVSGDYTEEQAAFVEEYNTLVEDYNAALDVMNATPELLETEGLVDTMNELTSLIEDVGEICEDPALLTDENMEMLRTTSFAETYKLIDQINAYEEGGEASGEMTDKEVLASLFTMAGCGADEAENTYYFLCDDEITVAAFVIVSADATQSANVVGQVTDNGDGSLTVTGEDGEYITFMVEEIEGGLLLTLEDGTAVTLVPWDINEAIDFVIAIDEGTEIVG